MQINKAQFVCSSERLSQLPKDSLPEFAFIGRSNVGKSSMVNMLTGRSGLAKVSGTPGKTRLINHFRINDSWYLVDLPGYGYARTSKTQRDEFAKIITDYVLRCERMHFLFVLVDSRLEPQKIDLRFIEMLGREGILSASSLPKPTNCRPHSSHAASNATNKCSVNSGRSCSPMFRSSSENGRAAKRS